MHGTNAPPIAPPTDQELLDLARTGDRTALDALIRKHANLVYGIALRQTNDTQLAADISQAVFIVFLRRISTIKSARALPAWFMQTTRFALLDARRAQRRRSHHERQAARPEHDMQQSPADSDQTAMLDDAIARLHKTDRTVIAMRFLQGREVETIAGALGITLDAARKRIDRAVARLKHLIGRADATLSVDALLTTAATMSMPSGLLESCASFASGAAGASTTVAGIAQGVFKAIALHKLMVGGVIFVASLAVAAAGVGAILLAAPHHRTITLAPPPAIAPAMTKDQAILELMRTYPPAPGQVIRVVPYPFSAARTAWVDAAYPYARGADNVRSIGLNWDGVKLSESYMSYVDQSLPKTVDLLLRIPWYNVDGLDKVKFPPMHSDFVVSATATNEQKLNALASLIAEKTGQHFQFVHGTRKRLCIVLHGMTHSAPANSDGFHILFLTQSPIDDALIARIDKGINLPGSTHTFSMDQASPILGAPFFIADDPEHNPEYAILMHDGWLIPIAADAQLKSTDPTYPQQLRKVLDNIQKQIGGDWQLETRDLEVFTLTPTN